MQHINRFVSTIKAGETFVVYLPTGDRRYSALTVAGPDEVLTRVSVSGAGIDYTASTVTMELCHEADRLKETFDREPETGDRLTFVKLATDALRVLR